jgi:hypothetical protein
MVMMYSRLVQQAVYPRIEFDFTITSNIHFLDSQDHCCWETEECAELRNGLGCGVWE